MGSTYDLAKETVKVSDSETNVTEVYLSEMSCKLDLNITNESYQKHYRHLSIKDLTPDQVRDIALKMIQSASYFTEDPDQFMKDTESMLNDHHINNIGVVTK